MIVIIKYNKQNNFSNEKVIEKKKKKKQNKGKKNSNLIDELLKINIYDILLNKYCKKIPNVTIRYSFEYAKLYCACHRYNFGT